jgi:hypothetical protein
VILQQEQDHRLDKSSTYCTAIRIKSGLQQPRCGSWWYLDEQALSKKDLS